MDSRSQWSLTADSDVSALFDGGGVSDTSVANIAGNGHSLYYDGSLSANIYLDGNTATTGFEWLG